MLTLTIDNSICKIEGLTAEQHKSLREVLSYKLPPTQSYFSGDFNTKKYLIDRYGAFPTGLLYLVEKWLKSHSIISTTYDLRKRPNALGSIIMKPLLLSPYAEQENAATACLNASRGIVVAPTGLGKSLIVALIINKVKVPTLVVVPSLELKRQLTTFLVSVYGKKSHFLVANIDSLSLSGNYSKYGCVIIDEFHHSAAKTYRELNKKAWSGIYYKFGLTATPFRSQDHERLLLESVLSKVIYQVDYKTAVNNERIVPMEAYYIDLPKKSSVEGYTWPQVYHELVANNNYRNNLIAELIKQLNHYSTLCLVKEISHGENIKALLPKNYVFASGVEKQTKEWIAEFNLNKRKCLIGTSGVLGEGVDTKPCEFVIIAGLGKSRNQFMQQCGRGFRKYNGKESCKIILFRDPSHKFTLNHFNIQVKILAEEYGVKPVKLNL